MEPYTEVRIGDRFGGSHTYDAEAIAAFARSCGDLNPLHHDERYARASRVGGVIACGPEVGSRMMALTATHFARVGFMLGLEFRLRFLRPVYAGDRIETVWIVRSVEAKASLGGDLVGLRGSGRNAANETVIEADATVLVTPEG